MYLSHMALPKVSIAIPAYKAAFLSQAIDSVLAQTFTDWELIIVNDKSPGSITEIVERYTDSRIRYYVSETNIGNEDPAVNWNKCLSYAKGEFFALLCDDDFYEPTFIENLLRLADKYPDVEVFRSRVKVVDENNRVVDFFPSSPEWESCEEYIWHVLKGFRRQSISEFLYRTDFIKEKNGFDHFPKAWCADKFSIFRLSWEKGIVSSRNASLSFRQSGMNISTDEKFIREKIRAQKLFTVKLRKLLEDSHHELRQIIIEQRDSDEVMKIACYLQAAPLMDFIYLLTHRNTELGNFPKRYIVKSCIKRIFKLFYISR